MERLGWITNCGRGDRCLQPWLDQSAADLPLRAPCAGCGRDVELVGSAIDMTARAPHGIVAWPVVPPVAVGGTQAAGSARPAENAPAPAVEAGQPAWRVVLESGERVRIDKPSMIIGRSRNCDVIIPSAKVSRQHATLTIVDAALYIEDLGSANGTWKDDHKVSREALQPGDEVRVSDAVLRFEQE